MKKQHIILVSALLLLSLLTACATRKAMSSNALQNAMIRIAEIEIDPTQLQAYLAILKEESAASVRLEPDVLCIYPMYERDNPNKIRLLEIYASREAYQAHLKTPHFLHYKNTTLPMVKSLKLIDMVALDREMMREIFRKVER